MVHSLGTESRPQPDPLLTGVCELPLTRAVLMYEHEEDRALPGGRLADIGLGVVVDGSRPGRTEILDLGSGEVRSVTLDGPLVILGWVYSSTLRSLKEGVSQGPEHLRRVTFPLAIRVLERNGFSALTRPLVLRVGFRDLARDLDLHEGTAVRLLLPAGGVVRLHLDYEAVTLVARTGATTRNPALEAALRDAFSGSELLASRSTDPAGLQSYHMPLAVPSSVSDARQVLRRLRRGFLHLLARFEPERYRAVRDHLDAFGERDSLRDLRDLGSGRHLRRLAGEPRLAGRVH
jgi:hypothetical protein